MPRPEIVLPHLAPEFHNSDNRTISTRVLYMHKPGEGKFSNGCPNSEAR